MNRRRLKPCPHCRTKVRLSQKTATVAENCEKTAAVALFCDSVDRAGLKYTPERRQRNAIGHILLMH